MKTINYDTQEEIQPKGKRTKLTQEENKLLISIGILWVNLIKKNTKLEDHEMPINKLNLFIIPVMLREKWGYNDFKGLFEHWFKTSKEDIKPNFHFCLTEQNITKYKIQKRIKDTPKTLSQMADEIIL